MASLILLVALLPSHWAQLMDLTSAPPPALPPPSDTPARAKLAAANPTADTLWRLILDANHFVRGTALEALARAHEGQRADPRRVERLRDIALDDTDWNRRSACVLLIQIDAIAALPLVEPLFAKTTNVNTRTALLEALKEQDGGPLRTSLVKRKSALLAPLVGH